MWGGVALLVAGLSFSAGDLSAREPLGPLPGSPPQTAAAPEGVGLRRPLAPRQSPLAEGIAPASSALSALAQPGPPTPLALTPFTPRTPAQAPAPFLEQSHPTPPLAIRLDPLAEELLVSLMRIRGLQWSHAPLSLVMNLQEQAPLAAKQALLLALTAYFPDQGLWPSDLPTTKEYVLARHASYLQEPEDLLRRYQLERAISQAAPGVLDFAWLARLSEAHTLSGELDEALARLAPRRAAALFAAREGGLDSWQALSVARSLGAQSPRAGAALALEHLAETWDHELLELAHDLDPAATAAFARKHQGDPRFRSAQALFSLERSADRSETLQDWYQHLALAERTWRRVLPEDLGELLELIEQESAWTPFQERITRQLLESGDEDLALVGFYACPVGPRLTALAKGQVPLEESLKQELLSNGIEGAPFAVQAKLHDLLQVVPRLTGGEVLNLAARLQELGGAEAARQVLDHSSASDVLLEEAKTALEAGLSLRDVIDRYDGD